MDKDGGLEQEAALVLGGGDPAMLPSSVLCQVSKMPLADKLESPFPESYRIPQTSLWEVLTHGSWGMAGTCGPLPAQEAAWSVSHYPLPLWGQGSLTSLCSTGHQTWKSHFSYSGGE